MISEDERTLRAWKWMVLGAPVWWVLGLNLIIYHLASFVLCLSVIHRYDRQNKTITISGSAFLLLLVAIVYASSILIHAFSSEFSRVVAACYNLAFWVMGILMVTVFSNLSIPKYIPQVLGVFPWLAGFIGILTLGVMIAYAMGAGSVAFATPLYGLSKYLGQTSLVERSLSVKLMDMRRQPLKTHWKRRE